MVLHRQLQDLTHHRGGGCNRWYSCCCCPLGQLDLEATCCMSFDSDNVLLHKVKAVEDPLVLLSIVSCAITGYGLVSFPNLVHILSNHIFKIASLYVAHLLLLSIICSSSQCSCMHLTFLLKRHSFPFSHLITLSSWLGVRMGGTLGLLLLGL